MRWTRVNRARAVTAAVASASMLLVVVVLILVEAPPYLGWLPPSVPLLVAVTAGVAGWRAGEAVAALLIGTMSHLVAAVAPRRLEGGPARR